MWSSWFWVETMVVLQLYTKWFLRASVTGCQYLCKWLTHLLYELLCVGVKPYSLWICFTNMWSLILSLVEWLRERTEHLHGWRHSIVVRMLVSAGELSLSCTRLLAGWVTTLRLSRPLLVIQHGQLSHPSSGVGKWVVIHVIRYMDYGVKT